jgi:hypothetical protein
MIALSLLGAAALFTRVSVDPIESLNPDDPLATPFRVSNVGTLPLRRVYARCLWKEVETAHFRRFKDLYVAKEEPAVKPWMSAGEVITVLCESSLTAGTFTKADIHVTLFYTHLLVPFNQKKWTAEFAMTRDSNGRPRWLQRK